VLNRAACYACYAVGNELDHPAGWEESGELLRAKETSGLLRAIAEPRKESLAAHPQMNMLGRVSGFGVHWPITVNT
jgi:hypothetical protein